MKHPLDFQPRKRFGQHFLQDTTVIDRIIHSIAPSNKQHLVEIGPGLGAITLQLAPQVARLDLIELDTDCINRLEPSLSQFKNVHIHQADALNFNFCSLAESQRRIRLVGNLPYNISTPLVFYLLTQRHCIEDMCFMFQKEVVDRLCAKPGSKTFGRLSIMVQWQCQVERLFNIGADAFRPRPKVSSSVVILRPYDQPLVAVNDPQHFAELVRSLFNHRRKTIRNSLKGLINSQAIEALGIDPSCRAETLEIVQFAALSNTMTSL